MNNFELEKNTKFNIICIWTILYTILYGIKILKNTGHIYIRLCNLDRSSKISSKTDLKIIRKNRSKKTGAGKSYIFVKEKSYFFIDLPMGDSFSKKWGKSGKTCAILSKCAICPYRI